MQRLRISILLLSGFGLLVWAPVGRAQDDGPSLGDVARNLRKSKEQQESSQASQQPAQSGASASRTVIDNDNLGQAIEDARSARPIAQDKTVFSVDPAGDRLTVKSADVTCSLSFNAQTSSLLIKPVLVEDLPLDELVKIDGPGSIQDESLQLEVFNGTEWDLREITVGLTLERKPGENAELAARARVVPAAEGVAPAVVERRSDVTLLYHLKAEAKPFSTTSFHENIGITPGADEDWRWSIVAAKGVRPAGTRLAPESLSEPLFGDPLPFVPSTNEAVPEQGVGPLRPMAPAPPEPSPTAPEKATPLETPGPAGEKR